MLSGETILEERLVRLAQALVDQQRARIIVPPQQPRPGFWFGGGNLIESDDGTLYLTGRYRNHGDSRTGTAAGERGLELAIFASTDRGATWHPEVRFSKSDLDMPGRPVLSIEGSALHRTESGVELFVSTEKDGIGYPPGFQDYLKPGTGVWTIERLAAASISELKDASPVTVVDCGDPRWLHVKDPFVYDRPDGELVLLFCSHPFSWSSSSTGFTTRPAGAGDFKPPAFDVLPRGTTWDVAMTRGTCVLDVPRVGMFANQAVSLIFYDGGESLRNLDEHATAVRRPRGYSCEELGGAAWCRNGDLSHVERLSKFLPLFVSPHGTGCSRYVSVLNSRDAYFVTWQQSQPDGSQPLMLNVVSHDDVAGILN